MRTQPFQHTATPTHTHPSQSTSFPLDTGTGWDNISAEGKDLVRSLLHRDPRHRYGIAEVLNHPWMIHRAPALQMDTAYISRIKSLSLRQQLRLFFLRNDIESGHKERRDRVHRIFPFLKAPLETMTSLGEPSGGGSSVSDSRSAQFGDKLQNMKNLLIRSYSEGSSSDDGDCRGVTGGLTCIGRTSSSLARSIAAGKINYGLFVSLLLQCQLPELAQPEVFSIFDIDGSGRLGNCVYHCYIHATLIYYTLCHRNN